MGIPAFISTHGFTGIVSLLFLAVGAAMIVRLVWCLVTGGPRGGKEPDAPHLYSRVYYLLFLAIAIPWTALGVSSCADLIIDREGSPAFFVCWAFAAMPLGLLVAIFHEMMIEGAEYLSRHGFILTRPFHAMHLNTLQRSSVLPAAVVISLAGLATLGLNVTSLADVAAQLQADAWVVYGLFAGS